MKLKKLLKIIDSGATLDVLSWHDGDVIAIIEPTFIRTDIPFVNLLEREVITLEAQASRVVAYII